MSSVDISANAFGTTYSNEKLIGEGRFGKVHKLRNNNDGMEYACKFIKLPTDCERQKQFITGKACLRSLGHDNIAQVFHVATFRENLDGNY